MKYLKKTVTYIGIVQLIKVYSYYVKSWEKVEMKTEAVKLKGQFYLASKHGFFSLPLLRVTSSKNVSKEVQFGLKSMPLCYSLPMQY